MNTKYTISMLYIYMNIYVLLEVFYSSITEKESLTYLNYQGQDLDWQVSVCNICL